MGVGGGRLGVGSVGWMGGGVDRGRSTQGRIKENTLKIELLLVKTRSYAVFVYSFQIEATLLWQYSITLCFLLFQMHFITFCITYTNVCLPHCVRLFVHLHVFPTLNEKVPWHILMNAVCWKTSYIHV